MTTHELIDRMATDLNGLTVQGVANMGIVLRVVRGLNELNDMLLEQEKKQTATERKETDKPETVSVVEM